MPVSRMRPACEAKSDRSWLFKPTSITSACATPSWPSLQTNLNDLHDPACFLIAAATPEGQAAGLVQDSLFSGYLISLMSEDRLQDVIGKLSDEAMQKVDACLKAALGMR
jgi:hypothetical protein